VSRRGCPQQIISDNGAQFRLTKILGDRAWKYTPTDQSILSYSAESNIQWTFIVELAPWQGGHYERLVGVVKSVLRAMTGRRLLSWSDLVTLLAETEAIANSRPISHVANDLDSAFRVLRPVDFLLFRPNCDLPPADTSFPVRDLGDGGKQLASLFKSRERYLNRLWSLWYDDYLLSLRERTTLHHKSGKSKLNRTPSIGEVVLLREDGLPRGSWRIAKIVSLLPSADGQIRAAEIRLPNGTQLRRTVNFLVPLEVSQAAQPDPSDADVQTNPTPSHAKNDATSDTSPTQDENSDDDEDDAFYGFSQQDIDRAADLLRLYDDIDDSQQ